MSLITSVRAELLKTKRSAALWLTIAAASFIPVLFILIYLFNPSIAVSMSKSADPWKRHFSGGWQFHAAFLLPMFVVLICALITQIEFKNNTWKQVFASPQSVGAIYFSKFITIHLMILAFLILFNVLMLGAAGLMGIVNSKFTTFFHHTPDWSYLARLTLRMYISVLGLSALQYWLSLRIKNFIGPVGIGLALYIGGAIALGVMWKHVYKIPTSYPQLSFMYMEQKGRSFLENHEWNSIGYFVLFTIGGFLDLRTRKDKG